MARSFHTHELGRLVIGCPACIHETRTAEEAARWDEAPVRKVTWRCRYLTVVDDREVARSLVFSLPVKVPDDATPAAVDEHYAERTGEAFVLALPDTVPMNLTERACETMSVVLVTIGPLVAAAPTGGDDQPGLFDDEVPA